MNVDPRSYSNYLLDALRRDAKVKLKNNVGRSSPYKDIWKCLDSIYDGEWTVANATIENLFKIQHPCPNAKDVSDYWYKAGGAAKRVEALGLSG